MPEATPQELPGFEASHIFHRHEWRNERGDTEQVGLTVLNEAWEPLWDSYRRVGPFEDHEHAMRLLYVAWNDYRRDVMLWRKDA